MIELAPFELWHAQAYVPQPDERHIGQDERMAFAQIQASCGPAWTAIDEDGQVVAVGGICNAWNGRGIAWCGLSADAGRHMLRLTKMILRLHDALKYRRIEMYADAGSPIAGRWAVMLGFKLETPKPMRCFLPDGRDAMLYAKVNP